MHAEQKPSEVVEAEGHLIDSQVLNGIFDTVIKHGGAFEVQKFKIGRTNDEMSQLKMKVTADTAQALKNLVEELVSLGCHSVKERDALVREADRDGCAPEDFYSTTNQQTFVRYRGVWVKVDAQRMDAVIAIEGDRAVCRKLRDIRVGNQIVCGVDGIRVSPEFRPRDRHGFAFMTNDVSSERRVEASVGRIAEMMRDVKRDGGRIALVAGPVVVHTGGSEYCCQLINLGYVDVLLAGNALAVHDIEHSFYGTSLGVDLKSGATVEGGHRYHMRAINTIARAGGVRGAVATGVLQSGIMYECVKRDIALRPGRQHSRRWPVDRDGDGPQGGAGSIHGRARRCPDGLDPLHDAARHRSGQHVARVGAGGLRRHQSCRRDEARRSRVVADDRHRHRRGPLPAPAGQGSDAGMMREPGIEKGRSR